MSRSTRSLAPRRRGLLVAAVAVAAAMLFTGCATDPLADQYRQGSDKGFISGDGTYTEILPADRGEPIEFTGSTETGDTVSSADFLGQVLVVNFWYAECAPCRAEAPDLESAYQATKDDGASFLGVNVRNQAETAISFAKTHGITFPSVIDTDSALQLAFTSDVPPNAVPTTLVLDKEGRVASRILGQLRSASILETLVRQTLAEGN
ncbi:TlpA disulfide reductase family protein [Homoserinimonas sp. OAct 916]|uniref:TlpA disulfide reductase family protein n=1 Tax=Homoserinimonas sp. OAct 916 TaxID=2211450 RepID=UPI000DBE9624|nr:TlpA disulfide reductase family protein [Homoserinimonas sp. OAct 916]